MRGSAFDQQNPAKHGDQRFSERFNTLTASLVYLGSLRIGWRHGLSCDRGAPAGRTADAAACDLRVHGRRPRRVDTPSAIQSLSPKSCFTFIDAVSSF